MKSILPDNAMSYLSSNIQPLQIHPLDIMDQPHSGYIIDIVYRFRDFMEWRFDHESLCALLSLVSRYFSAMRPSVSGAELSHSNEALILRLQVAGQLVQDRKGYFLSDTGEVRRAGLFSRMLADPLWEEALERVKEDLMVFAETEGIPLATASIEGSTQKDTPAKSESVAS